MDRYTEPHWDRSALITIDVQRDTLDGQPFDIPGTSAVLPALARALRAARAAGRPIVHVVRLYEPDGSNVDLCRRARVEAGWRPVAPDSDGSQLAGELLPDRGLRLDARTLLAGRPQRLGADEDALYKPRWGAFYRTPLEDMLRARGVDTLVFGGCNFPNCPRTSIFEASERDFRVVLLADAVSRLDERGREEMHGIGVVLLGADEYAAAVRRRGADHA